MKPKKNILIIDDEDQTKIVEGLQLNLKKNFDVNFILIKTNDVAFQNDDADLDIIKIKERIANDIQSITVDLALTDYDLGDEHVDGLNIIEILKEIRPNVRVILYSGNQDKVIRKIVGNNPNTEDLIAGFKKLLNFGIIDFVRRPDYRDRIIKYLNSNKKIHLESYFLIQLRTLLSGETLPQCKLPRTITLRNISSEVGLIKYIFDVASFEENLTNRI